MNDADRNAFEAWRRKAEEDLAAARVLSEHGGPEATICFLCHQATEKLLKGLLWLRSQPPRRIHHLDLLLEDCIRLDDTLADLVDEVTFLKRYYIAVRYPDDLPEDVSQAESEQSLSSAIRIHKRILNTVETD